MGIPYDSEARAGHLRGADRHPHRRGLRRLAPRWPPNSGRSPASSRNREPCCGSSATTAGPPTATRAGRVRGAERSRRWPSTRTHCPTRTCWSGRAQECWDRALELGEARLPQRPGHGHRADRHHRPGDGLRHHRHRARLRPGQVQEAGRRRLLQDRQPESSRIALQTLGYAPEEIDDIVALLRRARHARGRRRSSTGRACSRRASTPTTSPGSRTRSSGVFELRFAFNRWTLGEDFCKSALGFTEAQLDDWNFDLLSASASPPSRSPRPTTTSAAP